VGEYLSDTEITTDISQDSIPGPTLFSFYVDIGTYDLCFETDLNSYSAVGRSCHVLEASEPKG
jgi:hypothetical protein